MAIVSYRGEKASAIVALRVENYVHKGPSALENKNMRCVFDVKAQLWTGLFEQLINCSSNWCRIKCPYLYFVQKMKKKKNIFEH